MRERIVELESQLNEFTQIREPDWLRQLHEAELKITYLENEKQSLKSEIELLSLKIKEIDRLKQFEGLVQSQKWTELGQLAESMKNLSDVMSSTAGSTLRITMEEI